MRPVPAEEFNGHPSVLRAGVVLQDRYCVVRQLGKGGMGAVYEALDQRLEATVALKETFSVDARLRRQFEQEARLLAQLHHSALPKVSDYFTEGDRAFLVMQFISGVDLAQIMAEQPGPFPRNLVIAWADQLLDALVYLHGRDRQIIHRDIKPHNLKVSATGQIALLDFGLAKAQPTDVSGSRSSSSIFGYTRRYSPLEQIQDQGTTPRSDIYALGATLYQLLTGVKPADALARATAVLNSKPDPLRPANEINRAVGPRIAAILQRAMAQNAADRYSSANDFREALRQVGQRQSRAAIPSADSSTRKDEGDSTVNITMVRRRGSTIDPFDSYSILKPDDVTWLSPKQNRRPAAIAAILAVLLAVGFGLLYGFSNLLESPNSVIDYAKTAEKNATGATFIRQSKPEKPRPNATGNTDTSPPSAVSMNRSRSRNTNSIRADRNR